MAGIAEGIPGAKAFDEVYEQKQLKIYRDHNDGENPRNAIVIEPQSVNDFRAGVLQSLGVGRNVTSAA